jgi:hypothetical protein
VTPSPPSAASHDPLAPHFVFDEELEIPDIPHPLQPLTGPGGRLILEGEAEDRPICLAGRRALVLGSELDGVHEVHVHPIPVLKEMETGLSPATSLRIGPGTIRRRIPDSEGPVLERVLALRELPGVVFQWIRAPEAEGPLELDLSWTLGPFAPSEEDPWTIRYRHLGPILRVALDPSGRGVLVFLSVAPREWEITCESTDAGSLFRVSAPVRGERGDAIQLAVIGGTGSAIEQEDSLSALRFLGTQESRWETRERSSRQDSLRLVAPEQDVEEALEWAKARIDAAIIQDPQRGATVVTGYGPGINTGGDSDGGVVTRAPGEEEEIWAALGGLAAGHVLFARTVLADACNARTWNQGGELSVHAAPLFLYLVGQYVHWTGDSGILRSERQALDDAVSWCTTNLVPGSTPASVVRWSAGSYALAEAVEGLGASEWAASLKNQSLTARQSLPDFLDGEAELLGSLLLHPVQGAGQVGVGSWPQPPVGFERGLQAWAAYRAGASTLGLQLLREHLGEAFQGARGAWPDSTSGCPNSTAAAAMAITPLILGMLGVEPDAGYGRVRIAPQLPPEWEWMNFRNLKVGDARLDMEFRREGSAHEFFIEQTAGKFPLTVVFEPMILAREISTARVGGVPAGLDMFQRGDRAGIRLQFPLDRAHTIALEEG